MRCEGKCLKEYKRNYEGDKIKNIGFEFWHVVSNCGGRSKLIPWTQCLTVSSSMRGKIDVGRIWTSNVKTGKFPLNM